MQPEETPRGQLDRKPDEELATVYWVGDPSARGISVGSVADLMIPANKQIQVPVSIAVYLTGSQPSMFSAAPPLAKAQGSATSTPKESPKE